MTAADFTLPGVDGRDHTYSEYEGGPGVAVVFTCNHCPYAQAWEGRLVGIGRDYAGRFPLVAISSNNAAAFPEDSFEEMGKRAMTLGYTFDYLYDESQVVARACGAERTPEVFVFDAGRRLVYHGAIDDSRDEPAVTQHYLRDALDALLEGREPPVADTPPVGCSIKWRAR